MVVKVKWVEIWPCCRSETNLICKSEIQVQPRVKIPPHSTARLEAMTRGEAVTKLLDGWSIGTRG